MERFRFILITAGVLSFAFAFVVMAVLPWATYKDEPILTVAELAEEVPYEFHKLARDFPAEFEKHFGEPNSGSFAEALVRGHQIYVAEGCWHCHSQQIRPVSNEDIRWGEVSYPQEFQNELQMPVLFGTRRIGPDLIRSHARHSNGWHMAHFYRPTDVVPDSVMPNYPWFFEDENTPGRDALAITTYVQWLGSWVERDREARAAKLAELAEEEYAEAVKSGLIAPTVETTAPSTGSEATEATATEVGSNDNGGEWADDEEDSSDSWGEESGDEDAWGDESSEDTSDDEEAEW